ncbi:hypothetical protein ACQEVY_20740 [Streptomyces sp. CA-288835]|uniref:hypothetical protein n=1 Tax=Streptomyces sp. CA-288835 TaxID=3240069 RepID=UPI003D8BA476
MAGGSSRAVGGKIADVGVHKGYAYLASWGGVGCDNTGVYVVDIRKPSKPKEVGFIPAPAGSLRRKRGGKSAA